MAAPTGQLIGGREVPGGGTGTAAVDARTGRPFGPAHPDATPDQVAEAVQRAAAAAEVFGASRPVNR